MVVSTVRNQWRVLITTRNTLPRRLKNRAQARQLMAYINNLLLMMHYSMIAKIQALLDVALQRQIRQIVFKHTV